MHFPSMRVCFFMQRFLTISVWLFFFFSFLFLRAQWTRHASHGMKVKRECWLQLSAFVLFFFGWGRGFASNSWLTSIFSHGEAMSPALSFFLVTHVSPHLSSEMQAPSSWTESCDVFEKNSKVFTIYHCWPCLTDFSVSKGNVQIWTPLADHF